jgi:hypothetical protein
MTQFTFTITYRGDSRDPVTVELPDRRTAWKEAVALCGQSMEDLDGDFDEDDEWLVSVADERSVPLFEIRCVSRHFR